MGCLVSLLQGLVSQIPGCAQHTLPGVLRHTEGGGPGLSTREAVAGETPDRWAISFSVTMTHTPVFNLPLGQKVKYFQWLEIILPYFTCVYKSLGKK